MRLRYTNRGAKERQQQPMEDLHEEPEGGGAHWAVGRPGWSADQLVGTPTFPFWPVGYFPGPLVIGTGVDFWCVDFLL